MVRQAFQIKFPAEISQAHTATQERRSRRTTSRNMKRHAVMEADAMVAPQLRA
jgi:hypothetical protein